MEEDFWYQHLERLWTPDRWQLGSFSQHELGIATTSTRHNLSECVVNGTDTAICLGIPSGRLNVSSLGHHTGWSVLDATKMAGSLGSKTCMIYEVMFSSNFDFKNIDGKLPGLSNAPLGTAPPNDHLCHGSERLKNSGVMFSTRLGFSDTGGSSAVATARLANNFKNDMFRYDCTADGNSRSNEFLTEMRAQDPAGDLRRSSVASGTGSSTNWT